MASHFSSIQYFFTVFTSLHRPLQLHCIAFDMVVKQGTPPELVPTLLLCYVTCQRMPYSVQLLNSPKSKEELHHIKRFHGELKHYLSVAVPDSEQCQKAAKILVDFSGRCYNNGITDKRNQSIYFKCGMCTVMEQN